MSIYPTIKIGNHRGHPLYTTGQHTVFARVGGTVIEARTLGELRYKIDRNLGMRPTPRVVVRPPGLARQ